MTTLMATTTLDDVALLPGLVVAFLYFEKPLDVVQIRQLLKERLLEIPRFRSLLRMQGQKTVFIECDRDKIPLDTMVEDLPIKTKQEVDDFCSKMYEEKFGNKYPLWRAYTFNNMEDGRSCFCFCVDHVIGDGVSLVATLMSILDDKDKATDGSGVKGTAAPKKRAVEPPSCGARIGAAIGGCFDATIGDQLPGDPPNRLKMKDHRRPGRVKSISQSEHISLDKVKEIAKLFGSGTVNDVLMTILTMTLQSYFEKCEPATLEKKFRALFIISMRPQGADVLSQEYFGNLFSNGKMRFPMHLKTPKDIFLDCKKQVDYIKISPAPIISTKMSGMIANNNCISSQTKLDLILDLYGKCSACISNVMGPGEQVSFGGQPLEDLQFYAYSPLGVYFGIISYNGRVSIGVLSDVLCEPDATKLTDEWTGAFERLYAAAKA